MNKIKYIPFIALSVFIFAGSKTVSAECIQGYMHGTPIYCQDNEDDNNGSGGSNSNGDLNVSTLSATNIESDSATLRGDITDLDSDNDYVRFFEWGTDEDDLDETETVSGTTDNEGSFSRTISGLDEDETYYFRACAENDDNSSDDDCGSVYSFTTDDDNNGSSGGSSSSDGTILTTDASSVTTTSAIINGVVTNESDDQTVWFEWGPTVNLGYITTSRTITSHQSIVSTQINGLTPGRAYFFRLVSDNGERGDFKAFVTNSATAVSGSSTTTTTTTNNNTTNNNSNNSNSGSNEGENENSNENTGEVVFETIQYLNVGLISSVKEIRPGESASFAITYENVSDKILKNIVMTVDFPAGMTPTDIGAAKSISAQKIEVSIPALPAFTKGSITVAAEVGDKVANDTFLVTVIGATFDHPVQANTRVETLNSSIIRVSNMAAGTKGNNSQGASVASATGSFFPTSFLGWFILVVCLTILIVLSRKLYKEREEEAKKKKEEEKKKQHVLHPELKIVR